MNYYLLTGAVAVVFVLPHHLRANDDEFIFGSGATLNAAGDGFSAAGDVFGDPSVSKIGNKLSIAGAAWSVQTGIQSNGIEGGIRAARQEALTYWGAHSLGNLGQTIGSVAGLGGALVGRLVGSAVGYGLGVVADQRLREASQWNVADSSLTLTRPSTDDALVREMASEIKNGTADTDRRIAASLIQQKELAKSNAALDSRLDAVENRTRAMNSSKPPDQPQLDQPERVPVERGDGLSAFGFGERPVSKPTTPPGGMNAPASGVSQSQGSVEIGSPPSRVPASEEGETQGATGRVTPSHLRAFAEAGDTSPMDLAKQSATFREFLHERPGGGVGIGVDPKSVGYEHPSHLRFPDDLEEMSYHFMAHLFNQDPQLAAKVAALAKKKYGVAAD